MPGALIKSESQRGTKRDADPTTPSPSSKRAHVSKAFEDAIDRLLPGAKSPPPKPTGSLAKPKPPVPAPEASKSGQPGPAPGPAAGPAPVPAPELMPPPPKAGTQTGPAQNLQALLAEWGS